MRHRYLSKKITPCVLASITTEPLANTTTIERRHERTATKATKLPLIQNEQSCDFTGYDADTLMKETAKLRKLITKKGTLEILIPLFCTTNPVRHIKFRHTLKGFSSKTLAARLKELQKSGILERQSYNETPPRVEYRLTTKGQELVQSVIGLLQWMRKWSLTK